MGSIKLTVAFILLFCSLRSFGSSDTTLQLKKTNSFPGNFTDFYADNLGNLYLITATNEIKKIADNGDSLAVFNDFSHYGKIYSLDVSNPLKILVYYRDFSTVLVLDRFLNIVNTIDLRQSGILQVKAVARSYDNNIWLFDQLDGRLKKIDGNGSVLLESADFRLLFSEGFSPESIIDNNGSLYLYDPDKGWLIFDYYGALKGKIPFTGWKNVSVINNLLTGLDSSELQYYNPAIHQLNGLHLSGIDLTGSLKLLQQMQTIYLLNKKGLEVYTIQS